MNSARYLINSFEKIARLSGNIREQKNWHHFGIGERIRFLEQCEQDRSLAGRHDRKVWNSLIFYFFCIVIVLVGVRQIDTESWVAGYEKRYLESVLEYKLQQDPDNGLWLHRIAGAFWERQMEEKAISLNRRAEQLEPLNSDIKNNLAWLLLTAEDQSLRNGSEALVLAKVAVALKREGYILDTLATAFWANDLVEEAVRTSEAAIQIDPENRAYHRSRINEFLSSEWQGPQ
jgi:tetratricopeptide (TPR) repeat protein